MVGPDRPARTVSLLRWDEPAGLRSPRYGRDRAGGGSASTLAHPSNTVAALLTTRTLSKRSALHLPSDQPHAGWPHCSAWLPPAPTPRGRRPTVATANGPRRQPSGRTTR